MKREWWSCFVLLLVACAKSGGEADPAGTDGKSAPAKAHATCDVAAFIKDQADDRHAGTKRALSGCKFTKYEPNTKTAWFAGDGGKFSCINIDKPALEDGALADVAGTVDGGGDQRLYRCAITKR
jgi:hypothetical protein